MYFSFFIAFQIVNWSKVAANKICDVEKPKISFIFPQQIRMLLLVHTHDDLDKFKKYY